MITIQQLLESVDLDFEPRWVTKDEDGTVCIWEVKPERCDDFYRVDNDNIGEVVMCPKLKLSEFADKNWTKCIYEVPQKTIGNEIEQKMLAELELKLNSIVDAAIEAINELKGAKNE